MKFENFNIWYEAKGYPCIWLNGKSVKLHIFIWERENGKKPKGFDIHHKDFNKKNYLLSNLELLSCSDHQKIHAGWIKVNDEWALKPCAKCLNILPLSDFYQRKGYTPSSKCKKCHCEQTKKWSENNREKRRIIANRWVEKNWAINHPKGGDVLCQNPV